MAKLSIESRISKAEKTAEFCEKKAKKLWAQGKNGGPEQGYCFGWAREQFAKAKHCRETAENLKRERDK